MIVRNGRNLLTVNEIASVLKYSQSHVREMTRYHGFPRPVLIAKIEGAAGDVRHYDWDEVLAWHQSRTQRQHKKL